MSIESLDFEKLVECIRSGEFKKISIHFTPENVDVFGGNTIADIILYETAKSVSSSQEFGDDPSLIRQVLDDVLPPDVMTVVKKEVIDYAQEIMNKMRGVQTEPAD